MTSLLDPNESNSTLKCGWPKTLTCAYDVLECDGFIALTRLGYPMRRMADIYSRAREVAHMRMTGSMGDER